MFTVWYGLHPKILYRLILVFRVVLWFRRSVACLSPLRPGFDPRPVNARAVVEKLALGQGFLRTFRLSLISIIPFVLHIHLHLHVAPSSRTNGRSVGTFKKQCSFGNQGSMNRKAFIRIGPCIILISE